MTPPVRSLLSSRRFLPIFLAQFLGSFNDNLLKSALVVMITYFPKASAGSPFDAATLVTMCPALLVIPFLGFSATAGQLADKYEKSNLACHLKLLEIGLMTAAAIGFYYHSIWMLMIVLFFTGLQAALFGPLKYSILPDHLKESELVTANALVAAATFISILIGMILGALLIVEPYGWFYTGTLVMLGSIAGYIASRFIPIAHPPSPDIPISANLWRETRHVMRGALSDRSVRLSILGISWFMLVASVFVTQLPNYTHIILRSDNKVLTLFFALFSIGIALGATVCSSLLKGEVSSRLAPAAALVMSAFIFIFVWYSFGIDSDHLLVRDGDPDFVTITMFLQNMENYPLMGILLMIAISGGVFSVPFYAVMQARCEHGFRSRVIAASNVMDALFMTVAAVASTLLVAGGLHLLDLFGFLALFNTVVAAYAWWLLRKNHL